MSETPHLDPEEGVRALILKWSADDLIRDLPTDADRHVGEWLETGLLDRVPYVAVTLIGGPQDYFGSSPILQFDFFGTTRASVKSIAADTSLRLLQYPDSVPVGDRTFQVDYVNCLQQPLKVEWEDDNIRRMSARYELSVRR